MAQLDNDIGLVLQKLKDMGEDDNTIVVFTTDNGTELFTWPDGGTTPFAQCKGTVMEGGFRVPCILRWPGHVPADSVQNGIFSGLDWFPTFLAAAGNPNITDQLLKGVKLGDRTYKNHLDGYNQMAAITGKGPSARHEIFYLGESTVGAVRIDDYKYRFIDQPDGWLGEKTHVDVPYLINLRLDPFERQGWPNNGTKEGAQQYFDWFKFQFWRFVFVQQVVGKELQTFLDYPPMQRGASFNLDAVKAEMAKRMAAGGGGEQRHRQLTGMTFTAGGSQGPPACRLESSSIVKRAGRRSQRRPANSPASQQTTSLRVRQHHETRPQRHCRCWRLLSPASPSPKPRIRFPRGTTARRRQAIVDFVAKVTKEGSPDFVPPAERIATFDNDGTLWCEQPMYFQLLFALDRVKALAPQHPEWKDKEPFASLLKGDVKGALAGGEHGDASKSSWPRTRA